MLRVRIRDLVFVGDSAGEDEVYQITPDGFTGWNEGVDMRREEIMRPTAHGAFDVPGYLGSRVTGVAGEFWAPSAQQFEQMKDKLLGLLADGDRDRLTVDQDKGTQWADVRLAAKTTVLENEDMTSGRFQVQFWAPDPRKYGEQRTFAGGKSAYHYGNFPCVPRLVMSGSAPGYTINGPFGRQIVVTAGLGASGHVIDMTTGALYVGGDRVLGGISKFEPWAIPPGQSVIASATAGSLSVRALDTFI